MSRSLSELEELVWGNHILFHLATALGRDYVVFGDVKSPEKAYTLDPDELLEEALEVIWKYKELSK